MKQWLRLTLVCGVLVGLLLGLTQVVGLNYTLQVLGSGSWFDRGTGPASDAPTIAFIRSMEFHPPRAGPLESLVFDCALNADNIGPPGQETYGRPELMGSSMSCHSKPTTQSNAIEPFLRKITGSTDRT
jgi:hypothetical protein